MTSAPSPAHPAVRPGELREPIVVSVVNPEGRLFMSDCAAVRVAPERAYPLLLERRLLVDDVAASGLDVAAALVALNAAAGAATTQVALDGPSSAYLRSFAKPPATVTADQKFLASVPVRLYARALDVSADAVVEPGAVAQAVAWERASAAVGRTMAEWGLLVLLESPLAR